MGLFAQRPISRLPTFSYCGPELHYGGKAVLMGDAIHAVKVTVGAWGATTTHPDMVAFSAGLGG